MTDLSKTIAPKSDQLNADDMIAGPLTITITSVSANPGNAEQPVSVSFEGDGGKPYRPCKSMRRVMVAIWGADGNQYIGRSMTLYRDPDVTWGGMKVGGIRISHMSGMDKAVTMALTATQKQRKPFTVKPLAAAPQIDQDQIVSRARAAAKQGKNAFLSLYNSPEGKAARDSLQPHMSEFKRLTEEADAAKAEDPFGLPPLPEDGTGSTPEEAARLAEIERELAEQRAREAAE